MPVKQLTVNRQAVRVSVSTTGVDEMVAAEQQQEAERILLGSFKDAVRLRDVQVHYRTLPGGYARPLNQRRADKMAEEFVAEAMGVLLISMRDDGSLWFIDGQHRAYAALANGIEEAPAYVFIDLTLAQEAQYYRFFGDYLKQTAMDRFMANAAAGDTETLAIIQVVEQAGLKMDVGLGNMKGGVKAVEGLLKIRRQFGVGHLRAVLALLHEAFNGEPAAYTHAIMLGTAMFLDRFEGSANYKRRDLLDKLKVAGLKGLKAQAGKHQGIDNNSIATSFGKALRDIHDHGKQRKLGDWVRLVISPEAVAKRTATAAARRRTPEQANGLAVATANLSERRTYTKGRKG